MRSTSRGCRGAAYCILRACRMGNTGCPWLTGRPAHWQPALNRPTLRPISVVGTVGARQPRGDEGLQVGQRVGPARYPVRFHGALAMRPRHGVMREHAVVPRVRPQPIAVELRDTGQEGQRLGSGPGSSQHGCGQRVGEVHMAVLRHRLAPIRNCTITQLRKRNAPKGGGL